MTSNLFLINDNNDCCKNLLLNEIIVSFDNNNTNEGRDSIRKYLIDSLELNRIDSKSCPCSNFEVWGRNSNNPLNPEERGIAKRNGVSPKSGHIGESYPFSTSLNNLISSSLKIKTCSLSNLSSVISIELLFKIIENLFSSTSSFETFFK